MLRERASVSRLARARAKAGVGAELAWNWGIHPNRSAIRSPACATCGPFAPGARVGLNPVIVLTDQENGRSDGRALRVPAMNDDRANDSGSPPVDSEGGFRNNRQQSGLFNDASRLRAGDTRECPDSLVTELGRLCPGTGPGGVLWTNLASTARNRDAVGRRTSLGSTHRANVRQTRRNPNPPNRPAKTGSTPRPAAFRISPTSWANPCTQSATTPRRVCG